MDNLNVYRQLIEEILTELYSYSQGNPTPGVDAEIICDRDHDHYLLLDVGWHERKYVYAVFVHIDIKDGKIWIQRNNTEINIAERLRESGVDRDNIVLGSHSPFLRQFSGYAIA
ncbi:MULTISPECIES: XisI protein [unclassified Roseofilum]|uniref:XisI protein n=1 Tax=unclassified Roseofilum TaxID=2620099 RepID=UPI000E927845|nr:MULTISPECIES: XisI protein [unclassified Roseofilum]HBQ99437.1 XisI protein [Cyanobacteria bacterium UBA11691]MBP0008464.1 XisI protein [Roseofilum sp. Belize Diploria]MBP0014189.1 XisI protein [Roseofilum sp. SID3]MBP0024525.1 XisI protein [Roseofilum sp. SID2]MBP0033231.1 XisI protein [Roseofilum sp. Belize BBD 4]